MELNGLLSDHEDLLVFHLVVLVGGLEDDFDVVLDLGFGLLALVLLLEVQGRGDVVGQSAGEVYLVDAWVENASLDIEHAVLVLEELFAVLQLLVPLDHACLIAMSL